MKAEPLLSPFQRRRNGGIENSITCYTLVWMLETTQEVFKSCTGRVVDVLDRMKQGNRACRYLPDFILISSLHTYCV